MATARPGSAEEAASLLASATAGGQAVRFHGGGTKLGWGGADVGFGLHLATTGLDRLLEHSPGDLTAVLEAGIPLRRAQEAFAAHGQMLALDPPLGEGAAATVGGALATGDSGPLRHSYGSGRDLVLGARFALADGTLARCGGKVIKNVAGYDLAKLLTGSFGTLGLIVEVAVRLHPIPRRRATVVASSDSAATLQRAAFALAEAPLEAESLDLRFGSGEGALLIRFGGVDPAPRGARAKAILGDYGLEPEIVEDDTPLWDRQRASQRSYQQGSSGRGVVVRVSALTSGLGAVMSAAARLSGTVTARAALGVGWVRLPPASLADLAGAVSELRRRLTPFPCVVQDAPDGLSALVDPFGDIGRPELALMRRIKERFDPSRTCNPGVFAGGI